MKKTLRILARCLRAYAGTILLIALILAAFVGMHLLGGGQVRELRYALLLIGAMLAAAAVISFVRMASRLRALEAAARSLPEEASALPEAGGPEALAWRGLAAQYLRERRALTDAAASAEKERTDYYTLWLHQIKTPLSALDLLAQSSEEIDRPLMRQELLKVNQYAASALSYQRLQSLHGDLDLEEVQLYPLCCQAVRSLRPLFTCGRLSLTMEPFDDLVISDAKWLGVVVAQVLTNALKYTPEGGRITIRMAERDVLEIADTGIGIRPEDVPRVFERGFTGHNGRSHEKSTGIGLYLCREICDRLGHRISLTSRLGEGTRVRIDMRRDKFEAM